MLIMRSIAVPVSQREEPFTHLNLFIQTGGREQASEIKDWMHLQSFTVIAYEGWTDQFFFKELSHVMLLKLTFDNILIYVAHNVAIHKTKIPHIYERLIGGNIIRLG